MAEALPRISQTPAPPAAQPSNAVVDALPVSSKKKRKKRKRAVESNVAFSEDAETWRTPWTATLGMTEYESKEQRLHDEIVAYVMYMLPTDQERRAREQVIARVSDVVKRRFSDTTVEIFGSVAQDLYLPDGDIDLVMMVPRELDQETRKKMLYQLSAALRDSLLTSSVQVIHRARVPVVSIETTRALGSFKIDISINSTDGVKATPIIASYLDKMPTLWYLVMLCKGFLSCYKLNSASDGGLSSYGLMCMAISFLQLNPKQRPADAIQKPLENESLGILLMDFLDYYGNTFPYGSSYISVVQVALLPKESKGWTNDTQRERLSIECLVNPENDVGRPTSKIAQIRKAFREAQSALQSYPFGIAYDNALGTILHVSRETLAHREHVQKIVESGSLERALKEVKLPEAWSGPRRFDPGARPPHGPYGQASSSAYGYGYGYGVPSYNAGFQPQYAGSPYAGGGYQPPFPSFQGAYHGGGVGGNNYAFYGQHPAHAFGVVSVDQGLPPRPTLYNGQHSPPAFPGPSFGQGPPPIPTLYSGQHSPPAFPGPSFGQGPPPRPTSYHGERPAKRQRT